MSIQVRVADGFYLLVVGLVGLVLEFIGLSCLLSMVSWLICLLNRELIEKVDLLKSCILVMEYWLSKLLLVM